MTGTADDGTFTVNAIWFQIIKPKPITTDDKEEHERDYFPKLCKKM